ncbi:unnamed protein product [Dracunculus medinensis]|uniref:DNA primase large subunit n=1 Tax=Dracunculus medinensis TaxID=318479 RepID=A0A0N4U2N1_DRAME|nr:unnamed protein product [Dracunculus medinensis]
MLFDISNLSELNLSEILETHCNLCSMQFVNDNRVIRRSLIDGSRIHAPKTDADDMNLQMYIEPPTEDITLVEFEEMALHRLKVLKKIEELRDFKIMLSLQELSKLMPLACGLCPHEKLVEERKRDLISHFILRLAFCKTPEQTKWFIQHEIELFKYRFQLIVSMNFWKIPFVDALDLMRKRKVYLQSGYAYVSQQDLATIICTRLRLVISSAMAVSLYIGFIEEENRLIPLLNKLTSKIYLGKEYTGKENGTKQITPNMLDKLSLTSFPLCMRQIHVRLRQDHHLRHGARMQYGLFLKGIGLSLEDALAFWRAEFTKKMDSDKFDKQYAYNIRHNYGKEGKRANYSAYPCSKIILGAAPTVQDCHGCPYRHNDSRTLAVKLESFGISKENINIIITLAKLSQYDRACTRYFEFMHNMSEDSLGCLITHPNQYFELSQKQNNSQIW